MTISGSARALLRSSSRAGGGFPRWPWASRSGNATRRPGPGPGLAMGLPQAPRAPSQRAFRGPSAAPSSGSRSWARRNRARAYSLQGPRKLVGPRPQSTTPLRSPTSSIQVARRVTYGGRFGTRNQNRRPADLAILKAIRPRRSFAIAGLLAIRDHSSGFRSLSVPSAKSHTRVAQNRRLSRPKIGRQIRTSCELTGPPFARSNARIDTSLHPPRGHHPLRRPSSPCVRRPHSSSSVSRVESSAQEPKDQEE